MAQSKHYAHALVEFSYKSDKGRVKKYNQDAAGYRKTPLGHVLVVADGMGTEDQGSRASLIALKTIMDAIDHAGQEMEVAAVLQEAIQRANLDIFNTSMMEKQSPRMGSTCVVALISGEMLYVAHVGDSRVYHMHGSLKKKLTTDHTLGATLAQAGVIQDADIPWHPGAATLSRSLGSFQTVEADVMDPPLSLSDGDKILLCTDGLTTMVSDSEIMDIMDKSDDPDVLCQLLIDKALEKGGKDNITLGIIRYDGPGIYG